MPPSGAIRNYPTTNLCVIINMNMGSSSTINVFRPYEIIDFYKVAAYQVFQSIGFHRHVRWLAIYSGTLTIGRV